MYLRGMGAVATNPGFVRPGMRVLRIPLNIARRSRTRGMGQTCTNGGAWDPGLQVCCAPVGTPPMQDPCSILNNPGFIAQQKQQIAQDVAGIPASSYEGQTLAALLAVPVNIGNDAVICQSNPGRTFVDSEGITINCPAPSHTDVTTAGQPMSTYSTAQLAAMLNSQYGGQSPKTPGNVSPIPPNTSVAAWAASAANPANQQIISTPKVITFDGGPSSSGASSGGSSSGGSTSGGSSTAGADLISQITGDLSNSVTVGGMSLPVWGLAAAALAALWFFGGKH